MITTICKTIDEFHYKILEKTLSSHVTHVSCKDDNIFNRFFVGFFFKCSDNFKDEWIVVNVREASDNKNYIASASKRTILLLILQSAIKGKMDEISKIYNAAVAGNFSSLDPLGGTGIEGVDGLESGENPFNMLDLK